jgi:hypothetical protein
MRVTNLELQIRVAPKAVKLSQASLSRFQKTLGAAHHLGFGGATPIHGFFPHLRMKQSGV